MNKTYFKARLIQHEDGSNRVWFDEWYVIHETECVVFCVRPWCDLKGRQRLPSETNMQLAKRLNIRVKRINKENSRFAFATKEQAFERLKFVKHYHLKHLRFELQRVEQFVKQSQGKDYTEYQKEELVPVIFVSSPAPWSIKNETTD